MTEAVSPPGIRRPDLMRRVWRLYLAARRDRRIKGFLREACRFAAATPLGQKRAMVFMTPWPVWEQTPDYMITIALAMRYQGIRTELVWDDTPFDGDPSEHSAYDRITALTRNVEHVLPVHRVSQFCDTGYEALLSDPATLECARLNAYRRYRCETLDEAGELYARRVHRSIARVRFALVKLLTEHRPSYVLAMGGLYRSTGALVQAARASGVRVTTIDSGKGILLLSTRGVAANLDDLPRVFESLEHLDLDWDVRAAAEETSRRQRCEDQFVYQPVPSKKSNSTTVNGCALLALNQSFDTSALGRHSVFINQTQWMLRTVEWLLEHSELPIVVRRHPVERKRLMRSSDDYAGVLEPYRRKFPTRLTYVSETEGVSTYDFMRYARVVLVHTSSVGMEATMMGVPVVTQSRSAYATLGFAWATDSADTYYRTLQAAVDGTLVVTPEMKARASRCYFLTQCCNFIPVPESPSALPTWDRKSAKGVLTSPSLQAVLHSIDSDAPLALTRYLRSRSGLATS